MTTPPPLRIGTRKSPLAMWQAEHVASQLRTNGFSVELVPITTTGDVLQGSLTQSGGVGLFTKEIQRALLDGRCDMAVHSLKDLPTDPVEGLTLAAVPEREDPSDCLVSREHRKLDSLPQGAVVGTGSPRRRAQLIQFRPDLQFAEIRGNVETRLKKLADGEYEGIILAFAGLRRLGLDHSISETLSLDLMLPAVGQAALGLETRVEDRRAIEAAHTLDHPQSHLCVLCEREVLRQLRAGCLAPVAAHARILKDRWFMRCIVFSGDFATSVRAQKETLMAEASKIDRKQAAILVEGILDQLLAQGASALIDKPIVP